MKKPIGSSNVLDIKKKFEEEFPADYEGFGGLYDPHGHELRKTIIVNPEKIWNFFLPYLTAGNKDEPKLEILNPYDKWTEPEQKGTRPTAGKKGKGK